MTVVNLELIGYFDAFMECDFVLLEENGDRVDSLSHYGPTQSTD